MDSTLLAGVIAGAVGVIALFVQSRQNRTMLQQAARAEVWSRFNWAIEQASSSSDPRMRQTAWVVLRSLAADPTTGKEDRTMMTQVMVDIAQLGSTNVINLPTPATTGVGGEQ